MNIVLTGSIATDYLMVFPGRFREQLVDGELDRLSLSFLVDELNIHRGGVAANIAFGLGRLGVTPTLVGAVGDDFADYGDWLDRHGVDTGSVHTSQLRHTARFLCTTDTDNNQIASFYPGAMTEARDIELRPVEQRLGTLDLVVVSPNDPEAMLRHTQECRQRGYPFMADPSQQLARLDGEQIRTLVDGASYLVTNDYERSLLAQKTDWSGEEILDRVGTWITTRGADGATVHRRGEPDVAVKVPRVQQIADPTGVGDAFRSGYLAGVAWGLEAERSAQLGCMMATLVIETVGTQEYRFDAATFLERFTEAYGGDAASELRPELGGTS
ncbi:MAG: carbohydrate kinase family protein [Pseudonocardiaceae bacterium]|nr:carbohydrate kinase family protein [Pseudonocardiaceae bacterium]